MANLSLYLLLVLGVIFIFQLINPGITKAFIFDPLKVFSEPWRLVTSMFLHADVMHIFFNGSRKIT
ncbi:rhomboid family intramembrane serine protease [Candidatus Micrarchaeota archaeon]|nr:rhomboid family intramembrane serine protease [Candidatus Micrarchaeota archaeon]